MDEETGLYYYGARYYDPVTSIFPSVDPLADKYPSMSPYVYAFNNPLKFIDPTGMEGENVTNPPTEAEKEALSEKFAIRANKSFAGKRGEGINGIEPKQLQPIKNDGFGKESDGTNPLLTAAADYFRNLPFHGPQPNPFYQAEAIYFDSGFSFVGAEADGGVFFILAGKEKGTFKTFTEIAGGAAADAGVGFELGRIDVTGNPAKFNSEFLYGVREKFWISASPTGEVTSIGGAYSWGTAFGERVTAKSIQVGLGVSPLPFIMGGGYNKGVIKK